MGIRELFDWAFRDRRTGRITIAQPPNAPILVGLGALVLGRLVRRDSTEEMVLSGLAAAAITWWSLDELLRGVNPFRRMLGAGGLALVVLGLVRR